MNRSGAAFIVMLSLLVAVPAHAATLLYVISGKDVNAADQTEFASFLLDSEPVFTGSDTTIGFFVAAVSGTYTYGPTTTQIPQDISFYLDSYDGGGLFVGEGDLLGFNGPQLFDGPVDKPVLKTGVFALTDYFSRSPISLTVSEVPEPAGWAMMVAGFGLVGAMFRRRRTTGVLPI